MQTISLQKDLAKRIAEILLEEWGIEGPIHSTDVKKPSRPELGDLSFPCFAFKSDGYDPKDIAQTICDQLRTDPLVARTQATGPFANIFLDTNALAQLVCLQILDQGLSYGNSLDGLDQQVMVESIAPNSNKPLHLGHVRNALLGAAIANIIETIGYKVVRANLINDRGAHICKSMHAWQQWGHNETPETTGLKGDHFVGKYYALYGQKEDSAFRTYLATQGHDPASPPEDAKATFLAQYPPAQAIKEMLLKWEAEDSETKTLWARMNAWTYAGFDQTLSRLGIAFDCIYYESKTYLLGRQHVLDGLAKGLFCQDDDESIFVLVDLPKQSQEKKLLLRADGTSLYTTQDIGTAVLKSTDFELNQSIYVVGSEQIHHFQVLFLILKMLQLEALAQTTLYHLPYGMVNLPEGKMKSREGKVVDADDLMDRVIAMAREAAEQLSAKRSRPLSETELDLIAQQVGLGALKFFILDARALSDIKYNPEKSISFQGRTGPFVQYTHARIRSLIRKHTDDPSFFDGLEIDFSTLQEPEEHLLLMLLASFHDIIQSAATKYDPSQITEFLYKLARAYNHFYSQHKILDDQTPKPLQIARLALSHCTGLVIKKGLCLLDIEAPEKM